MEWPRVPLERILLEAGSGTWGSEPDGSKPTFPVLRSTNIRDGDLILDDAALRSVSATTARKYELRPGDILVTTSSGSRHHIGKNALVENLPARCLFSNFTWRLRPDPEKVVARYLYYYLNSAPARAELDRIQSTTSGLRNLNTNLYIVQPVPLPPLSEQRRIVEILDQADRLRRLRAEADAKADRILPALFIKMFGDPATNPMGWPVMPVGECLAPISRRDPSDRPDEPFTYIDIAGIDGKSGAICDTKELLGADAPSRARQVIKAGDILVSTVRPYLRATAMVPASLDGQVCSTGFCVLRPRVTYLRGYLYTLTRTTWFTDQLMARTRGASYPAVTDRDILELRVPLPSDPSLLERFDSLIETLIEQRARAGKCRTAVDQLFGNLLCRAFDGSLTASWREAHMKELLQEMEQQAKVLGTG